MPGKENLSGPGYCWGSYGHLCLLSVGSVIWSRICMVRYSTLPGQLSSHTHLMGSPKSSLISFFRGVLWWFFLPCSGGFLRASSACISLMTEVRGTLGAKLTGRDAWTSWPLTPGSISVTWPPWFRNLLICVWSSCRTSAFVLAGFIRITITCQSTW